MQGARGCIHSRQLEDGYLLGPTQDRCRPGCPNRPESNAGLIVWYAAGEERLGADIAGALIGSGFAVDSRLADFPKGPVITLGVRFLRQ